MNFMACYRSRSLVFTGIVSLDRSFKRLNLMSKISGFIGLSAAELCFLAKGTIDLKDADVRVGHRRHPATKGIGQ